MSDTHSDRNRDMSTAQTDDSTTRKPLRLWPGVVAAIVLASSVFTLVRTGGITGDGVSDLHWRWTKTPEQRLLARGGDEPLAPARAEPAALPPAPKAAETTDERLAGHASDAPMTPASVPATAKSHETRVSPGSDEPTARSGDPVGANTDADWPGFRGPERDGIVHGVRIT